jgi:GNAT superfamily N-acetyltransferase
MTSVAVIRNATTRDAELCAGILNAAFAEDPVTRWLIPERRDVLRIHYRAFHQYVRHGLEFGTVQIAGDAACAVWYPSGVPDMGASDHELEHYAERFTLFEQVMHDRHPDRPPHDYLMLLGARPEAQGRGLGSALLRHRLASLDLVGVPAYLVATTRRSAQGVYSRAGYRPLGAPIQFPEGLEVYPLWRDPQPKIAVA